MKTNKKIIYPKLKLPAFSAMIIFALIFFISPTFAKEINLKNTVELVNQSRNTNGLNELFINPTLIRIASNKADDMVTHHYFAHTSPQGIDPWYWFKKNKYNYEYAGENLAINYRTAEEQHQAWMNSTTHRKNILNPNYTEIGIATASGYIDNKPASITVQVFGKPQATLATSSTVLGSNNLIGPQILTTQFDYPQQIHYLKEATPFPDSHISKPNIQSNNYKIEIIKQKTRDFIWLTILILGIIITRELVLNSINNSFIQRHSTTNIILLLMLWSILLGL